jgi:hypothetical protein
MSNQVATVVVVGLFLLVVVLEVLFRRAMACYGETRWWRQTEAWLYLVAGGFLALLSASIGYAPGWWFFGAIFFWGGWLWWRSRS